MVVKDGVRDDGRSDEALSEMRSDFKDAVNHWLCEWSICKGIVADPEKPPMMVAGSARGVEQIEKAFQGFLDGTSLPKEEAPLSAEERAWFVEKLKAWDFPFKDRADAEQENSKTGSELQEEETASVQAPEDVQTG
jgi:hypothetical protein